MNSFYLEYNSYILVIIQYFFFVNYIDFNIFLQSNIIFAICRLCILYIAHFIDCDGLPAMSNFCICNIVFTILHNNLVCKQCIYIVYIIFYYNYNYYQNYHYYQYYHFYQYYTNFETIYVYFYFLIIYSFHVFFIFFFFYVNIIFLLIFFIFMKFLFFIILSFFLFYKFLYFLNFIFNKLIINQNNVRFWIGLIFWTKISIIYINMYHHTHSLDNDICTIVHI